MAVQGGYAINHPSAIAGMVVDAQLNNSVSKVNNTLAVVPYGVAVVRDTPDSFKLATPATVAKDIIGVLRRELNRATVSGGSEGALPAYDATVLTVGTIYVKVVGTVVAGDPAFVVIGNGTSLGTVGRFSSAVGAADTLSVALPNAKFITGATAGNLAALSIVVGG